MIPKQLWNKDFKFCLIRKQSKAPYERDWANQGHEFNATKLLNHISNGGNYGVIGGYGNLRILDKDDDKLDIDLETFCVKTGSGGKHYYFLSDYDTNHVFVNELGELRANNYQVVGVGSTHPNGNKYEIFKDLPLKWIPKEEVEKIIKPYLREEQDTFISNGKDTSGSGLEFRRVLAMIREKKTREQIYKEMMNYRKWASKRDDYRNTTYNKAMDVFLKEQEQKPKEVEEKEIIKIFKEVHPLIIKTLKKYCDIKEEYYSLIAVWILGTYIHNSFPTYPYLFLNAMRGSGKTRLLKLIACLSKGGEMLNSLTEAVLFRENNCICIDEFENLGRKGSEDLKELLNSAYKKGGKVKRMKKTKVLTGEEQKVETFDVYRPIAIANISGMDDVLGDRCIKLLLEKSNNITITKRMEIFEQDENIIYTLKKLNPFEKCILCRLCRMYITVGMYIGWDKYIDEGFSDTNIHNIHTLHNIHKYTYIYTKIHQSNLQGRDLELAFPLLILSYLIGEDVFESSLKTLIEINSDKKEEDILENLDVQLYDFVSQEQETTEFILVKDLTKKFIEFLQTDNQEITPLWMGRALKRLSLIRKRIRKSYGICVILNFKKAQEKIKMFK